MSGTDKASRHRLSRFSLLLQKLPEYQSFRTRRPRSSQVGSCITIEVDNEEQ